MGSSIYFRQKQNTLKCWSVESVTFFVSAVNKDCLSVGYDSLLYCKLYSPVKKTTLHPEVVRFVSEVRYIYDVTKSQGNQSKQGHQRDQLYTLLSAAILRRRGRGLRRGGGYWEEESYIPQYITSFGDGTSACRY